MQEPGKALWVQCGMLSVLLLTFGNKKVSGTHGMLQVARTVRDVFEANTHPFAVHIATFFFQVLHFLYPRSEVQLNRSFVVEIQICCSHFFLYGWELVPVRTGNDPHH